MNRPDEVPMINHVLALAFALFSLCMLGELDDLRKTEGHAHRIVAARVR
jgi:hypothetical protein